MTEMMWKSGIKANQWPSLNKVEQLAELLAQAKRYKKAVLMAT
jgi:hypothetical protein